MQEIHNGPKDKIAAFLAVEEDTSTLEKGRAQS